MTGIQLAQISPAGPTLQLPAFDMSASPELSGGVGGWAEATIPQTVAGTRYNGTPLYTLTFTTVFDGYKTSTPVEPQIRQLERWGQPNLAGTSPPPVLALLGAGYDRLRFVLNALTVPSSRALYRSDNQRTQAWCQVSLLEYRALTAAGSAASSVRAQILGVNPTTGVPYASPPTKVVVAAGTDTWRSIAARFLHDPNRWQECQRLNMSLKIASSTLKFGHAHHVTIPTR